MYPICLPYIRTLDHGQELRYSLRSLENISNFNGEVFIVGDSEVWFNNIHHIKLRRSHRQPYLDQVLKLKLALEYLPEIFIASMDDIYIMEPTKIGFYHQGILTDEDRTPHKKTKSNTKKLLNEMGIDSPLDHEVHYPMLVERDKLSEILDIILNHPLKYALQWRSLYGNIYKPDSQLVEDKKTKTRLLKEGNILSTNHYTPELHMHFPVASKYEVML